MSKEENIREIESVCTYCGVGCDITGVVKNNKNICTKRWFSESR